MIDPSPASGPGAAVIACDREMDGEAPGMLQGIQLGSKRKLVRRSRRIDHADRYGTAANQPVHQDRSQRGNAGAACQEQQRLLRLAGRQPKRAERAFDLDLRARRRALEVRVERAVVPLNQQLPDAGLGAFPRRGGN